jgi:hypothetical protein
MHKRTAAGSLADTETNQLLFEVPPSARDEQSKGTYCAKDERGGREREDICIYETVVETGGGGGPLAFSPATIDREMYVLYGCMDVRTVCMHAMLQYTTVLTLPRSLC